MKLDKHTLTAKKFYTTRKELDKVQETMRNLPYRLLKEPYQEGWILTVALRDDIARSNKAPVINDILERFCNKDYCRNPKHISLIRKKPALEDVRRITISKYLRITHYGLGIRDIKEKEYKELPPSHQKYFSLVSSFTLKHRYGNQIMYESNIPIFYFIVKTHKRIITKVQDIDPILKKKEAELKKILEPYYRTLPNGMGDYWYYQSRKEKRKSKVELAKMDMDE